MRHSPFLALLVFLPLAACTAPGDDVVNDAAADAPVHGDCGTLDGVYYTCLGLQNEFASSASSLPTSCDTDDDCVAIGGKADIGCDCEATLPGFAVSRASFTGSPTESVADQFYASCDHDQSVFGGCDAAPYAASCSNHVCVLDAQQSCL